MLFFRNMKEDPVHKIQSETQVVRPCIFFAICRQFNLTMRPPECLNMTSAPTCEDQKQAEARFIGWHHLKTTFRTPERISQLSVSHVRELFLVQFHEWPHLQVGTSPRHCAAAARTRTQTHAHTHTVESHLCVSLGGRPMHACVRACCDGRGG